MDFITFHNIQLQLPVISTALHLNDTNENKLIKIEGMAESQLIAAEVCSVKVIHWLDELPFFMLFSVE